ncbi:hypothetical protein N483_03935 [Pseudoalteromonas luteoviolacea NCIMB 1944]|uniref:Uncharacterized protein n=1 Tax=Pseudoalteromonas luteoviolacea (strain 2ta16) TaxID=1353533 RepID=V4HAV3_PSEL2|nr:hypothetical protein [Pseudoalteromonas luteoviolacea]ESP94611.1 hypothetical protein PL2TA16_00611 [Pseudoalteromonas luteoviolacea 2ta16]KZN32310.1 hypothetical protein N483_03935 [Pseudoalteromonas luteoviolacea NCIMB 1944]
MALPPHFYERLLIDILNTSVIKNALIVPIAGFGGKSRSLHTLINLKFLSFKLNKKGTRFNRKSLSNRAENLTQAESNKTNNIEVIFFIIICYA